MVTRNQHLNQHMNWFDRQFLRAQDFADESDYQVDRLRRHLWTLHTPGIAEGLIVRGQPGDGAVTVDPGTAIDDKGREIVLLTASAPLTLPSSTKAELYVSYTEAQTDQSQDPGITGYTRITEIPRFDFRETAPGSAPIPADGVLLAQLALASGQLTAQPDNTVQTKAGAAVGDVTAFSVTLRRVGQPSTAWPRLTASGPSQLSLAGDLRLASQGSATGALTVPGALTLGSGVQLTGTGTNQLSLAGDLLLSSQGTATGALTVPGLLGLGGGLRFGTDAPITAISRDPKLAAARDNAVPTEAAVKSYADHMLGIQTGQLFFSNVAGGGGWPTQTVHFQPTFAISPQVFVAVNLAEGVPASPGGWDVNVQNVTPTQADVRCGSSSGTITAVRVAWLAFGPLA
jgi:hypothetical protein